MYLLTFAIILVIVLFVSLITYTVKELKKPKGERFDVKGQINHKINTLKNLNKQKVKNFLFGTNFRRGWLASAVVYILLISIGFVYLYPVLYMISNSFKDVNDIVNPAVSWVPTQFYLDNFTRSFKVLNYFKVLLKSLPVTLLPALLQTGICSVIGYGFAKFEFKGKFLVLILVILAFIIPSQIYMIPKYGLYFNMGFFDKGKESMQFLTIALPALLGQGFNSISYILYNWCTSCWSCFLNLFLIRICVVLE